MLFLDGVGIGQDDPEFNPFARATLSAFDRLMETGVRIPLDASLGVPGLPQSGTGQTALFTGLNAAAEFGRHFGPWVPTALRAHLASENLLVRAKALGKHVAFANAYPEEVFAENASRRMRDPLRAGPPIVALAAGVLTRHTEALARGDAVASEILNDTWRTRLNRTQLPVITTHQAGQNLARIANAHDLTLFAHYATDHAGHRSDMSEAIAALRRVDEFLEGLLLHLNETVLLAVVSDHGNIEDTRAGHTMNPAMGLFLGAGHERMRGLRSLTDVAPALLSVLADA